ncbi:protein kinase domain-containing protein [Sorangium sp. So ce513]|uniref:serine/threonine-protein kinase n=1 Tax=Sorangium sp. So ce513 TaxID=3133315 RepID=UPI003F607647
MSRAHLSPSPAPLEGAPEGGALPGVAAPVGPPRRGDVIAGKYQVEGIVGGGGMGVVLSAVHVSLRQRFAVKFLVPAATQLPDAVARFLREAQSAVAIQSEHVTRVFDVGTLENGAPYIVMEHLSGCNLADLLRLRGQPMPCAEAVDLILQACEALAEAHALGIVHRDIKPTNLFVTSRADGSPLVKVLDFGLSKVMDGDASLEAGLTATNLVIGSPFYMSPEQIRSLKHVDARTDIWAVGVVLYELLTGHRPFGGDSLAAVFTSITVDPVAPLRRLSPEVPPALEAVVLRCLEKSVARRVQSVAELAQGLAPFAPPRSLVSVERAVKVLSNARRAHAGDPAQPPPAPPAPPAPPSLPGAVGRPAPAAGDGTVFLPWLRSFEAFVRAHHVELNLDDSSLRAVGGTLARAEEAAARVAQAASAASQAEAALAQARARAEEAQRAQARLEDAAGAAAAEKERALRDAAGALQPVVERLYRHDDMTNAVKREMGLTASSVHPPAPSPAEGAPAAPASLTAVAHDSRAIVVRWEARNPPGTQYLVEAAIGTIYRGFAVEPEASAYRHVGTVTDGASCVHRPGRVPAGTLVKYRVRAARAQLFSAYSDEVVVACR